MDFIELSKARRELKISGMSGKCSICRYYGKCVHSTQGYCQHPEVCANIIKTIEEMPSDTRNTLGLTLATSGFRIRMENILSNKETHSKHIIQVISNEGSKVWQNTVYALGGSYNGTREMIRFLEKFKVSYTALHIRHRVTDRSYWIWPYCYDPVWLMHCSGYTKK